MEKKIFDFENVLWQPESLNGYKAQYTFFDDFCTAEKFGIEAIKNTFERVWKEWGSEKTFKAATEIILVLNHKIWQWHEIANMPDFLDMYSNLDKKKAEVFETLYDELWRKAEETTETWSETAFEYYFNITD